MDFFHIDHIGENKKEMLKNIGIENIDGFCSKFETLFILLKLNQSLSCEIVSHQKNNLTLYARNKMGESDFCLSIWSICDENKKNRSFALDILSHIDLTSVDKLDLNYDMDRYSVNQLDEVELLDVMQEIVRLI
jgi:hypothetical protein